MAAQVQLIGVYVFPFTKELVATQAQILYGDNPSADEVAQTQKQLESTVLVEVLVSKCDGKFEVDFIQEDPQLLRNSWQAAWAAAFLSADGERLLVKRGEPLPPSQASFRVAFYIHYWKVGQPLFSTYGRLPGAKPSPMPARLKHLVPYELVD